jgi:hypothetical protein
MALAGNSTYDNVYELVQPPSLLSRWALLVKLNVLNQQDQSLFLRWTAICRPRIILGLVNTVYRWVPVDAFMKFVVRGQYKLM